MQLVFLLLQTFFPLCHIQRKTVNLLHINPKENIRQNSSLQPWHLHNSIQARSIFRALLFLSQRRELLRSSFNVKNTLWTLKVFLWVCGWLLIEILIWRGRRKVPLFPLGLCHYLILLQCSFMKEIIMGRGSKQHSADSDLSALCFRLRERVGFHVFYVPLWNPRQKTHKYSSSFHWLTLSKYPRSEHGEKVILCSNLQRRSCTKELM